MKKGHLSFLRGIVICVNVIAAAVLAVGFVAGIVAGLVIVFTNQKVVKNSQL